MCSISIVFPYADVLYEQRMRVVVVVLELMYAKVRVYVKLST